MTSPRTGHCPSRARRHARIATPCWPRRAFVRDVLQGDVKELLGTGDGRLRRHIWLGPAAAAIVLARMARGRRIVPGEDAAVIGRAGKAHLAVPPREPNVARRRAVFRDAARLALEPRAPAELDGLALAKMGLECLAVFWARAIDAWPRGPAAAQHNLFH